MPTDCASGSRDHGLYTTPQVCGRGEQAVTCVIKNQTKPKFMCGPVWSEATQFCHPPSSTNRTTNMPPKL